MSTDSRTSKEREYTYMDENVEWKEMLTFLMDASACQHWTTDSQWPSGLHDTKAQRHKNIGSVFPSHYLVVHNRHIILASLSRCIQYDEILLGACWMISVTYMSNEKYCYFTAVDERQASDKVKHYLFGSLFSYLLMQKLHVMHFECSTMQRRAGFRKCLCWFMHAWN